MTIRCIGRWAAFLAFLGGRILGAAEVVTVPAFTAYIEPEANSVRVSSGSGITGWKDPKERVLWFGELKTTGALDAALELRLASNTTSRLRLTVAGQSREVEAKGAGGELITARFGTFEIKEAGYQCFTLEALNVAPPFSDISSLVLDGPAVKDAHFNIKPRRNASSVHLRYSPPTDARIAGFYCEVTGIEEPVTTYYMACGWHRGYFGMQVNSKTERRIIFSVWDSGGEGIDRKKVADENRVTLLAKGEGVHTGDFGNEGTGGHSHLKFLW